MKNMLERKMQLHKTNKIFWAIAPEENCPPILTLTLTLTQAVALTEGR